MGRSSQLDLDPNAVRALWESQAGVCPVTGLAMAYPRERRHPCVATPTRTGEGGQVCLVCYFVAVLLRSFSLLEVRQLLRVAADKSRELLRAHEEGRPPAAAAGPAHIPQDIEKQLGRALNNSQRRAASRKKLRRILDPHSLTLTDLREMYLGQHGRCAITGVQLTARRGEAPSASMLTIDRIDSSLGYSVPNCQLLSFATNICKSDLSQHSFLSMLASMRV